MEFYAQSTSTVILGREEKEGHEKVGGHEEEEEGQEKDEEEEAEEEEDSLAPPSRQVLLSRQWVQTISRLISIKLSEAWEP